MTTNSNPAAPQHVTQSPDGLLRALTPLQSMAIVVGTLIGTGVFLVPREMVRAVHSFELILLAWVVGGLLSLCGALSYAELGTLRPRAGGEYVFLRDGFTPLLGFLFGWGMFWIIRPASVATVGAGLARAAAFLWPALQNPLIGPVSGENLLAAAMIALVTAINYLGVRKGGHVQTIFTALKLLLLAGLVIAAFTLAPGNWQHLHEHLPGPAGLGGFSAALVAALWAYDGWSDLTLAGSEVRDPQRTIPIAMIGGVLVVFLFYAAVNAAYFFVLTPAAIAAAPNTAAAMAAAFLGRHAGGFVAAAVVISAFATLNSSILSGARVPFAMAQDGLFFKPLARVHPRYRTPANSLLVQAIFAAVLALSGTYRQLYTLTIFTEWLFYMLAISALFALRRKGERGSYRTWGYPLVPAVFIVIAAILLVITFRQNLLASSVGLAIILLGAPFYFYWAKRRPAPAEPAS